MPSHWSEIHTDVPLSEFSLAFRNESFIADLVCPAVTVAKNSDSYYIYGTEDVKHIDTLRASKTASKGIIRTLSKTTYFCNKHALHEMVDDDDRANADAPIDPDMDAVEGIMELMAINKEREVATLLTATGSYSSASYYETLTGGDQWNDPGGTSSPIGKVSTAKGVVFNGSLKAANAMIIPYDVALVLDKHPEIVDYLKFVGKANLSSGTQQLADKLSAVFGLQVFVPVSAYDTTRQGQTGHTFSAIWSDYCIVFYLSPTVGRKTMAWCKNFSRGNTFVNRIPQADLGNNTEKIEVNDPGRDPKIVTNTAAYMFIDTLA